MMLRFSFVAFWLTAMVVFVVDGFIYDPQVHPQLAGLARFGLGTTLTVRLDLTGFRVHNNDDDRHHHQRSDVRVAVNGPAMELLDFDYNNHNQHNHNTVKLPVADSVYHHISSGKKAIRVQKEGYFVGLQGVERVPLEGGSWEMVWHDTQYCGRLICGFDVPQPIHRHGSTFDAGPIFLSFPCYSTETYDFALDLKHRTERRTSAILHNREVELTKMKTTPNPLWKCYHYLQAFDAYDKILMLPQVQHIPETDAIVKLSNGLVLGKHGKVLRNTRNLIGPGQTQVGTAVLSCNELLKP